MKYTVQFECNSFWDTPLFSIWCIEEVMKHLIEYNANDLSDIMETLKDAWMLSDEWEKFYSRHWEKYYKKKKSVEDQLEESRQTISKTDKAYLINNRWKMKEVTRKFLESKRVEV